MFEPKYMNWEKLFKQDPKRWVPMYDSGRHLIEVHDADSGNIWYEVSKDRWLYIS
jgi:hypothetical protein